jgi:ATP-dependent DNA helicase RecQ
MPPLDELSLVPQDLPHISNAVLRRLVNYLNRWEHYQTTLDCLTPHLPLSQVSLVDAQITALSGLGRYPEAIQIAEVRLTQKDSTTARLNLALLHLESGNLDTAQTQIREMARTETDFQRIHLALGRIALLQGDLNGAEASLLEFQKHYPNSRSHLPFLAQIALARGDRLTAGAYTVRAFTIGEGDAPIPILLLRDLRTLFVELGDERRVSETDAQLTRRAEIERAEISAALTEDGGERPTPARRVKTVRVPSSPARVLAPPLPDLGAIPVTEQERAEIETAVRGLFSFRALRPAQTEIIASVRRRENVLAILPTGAGKSLCYQLPAYMSPGLTLVISPLIALMKDQLDGLPSRLRNQAIAINSTLEGPALTRAIEEIAGGHYCLVYVAPERLRQLPFLAAMLQAGLTQLVIDEAHCVSVWGHDFRPDYLYIAAAWEELGRPPILALTATAPPRVREDIERRLFGSETVVDTPGEKFRYIALDTFRPNLHLSALRAKDEDEKKGLLIRLCRERIGSGIVYARSRQKCEDLAAMLRTQGVNAIHYHAGIENRAEVQEQFMSGVAAVIVATIAFGMGVDKADIRYIIHYETPDSVEAYYQQAGRAGRDGLPAACILLYSQGDRNTLTRYANQSAVPIEYLRQVFGWLRRILPQGKPGLVSLKELLMVAEGDEVKTRVALSLLEQAGMLQRHPDAPVQATLRPLPDQSDPAFETFVEMADLTPFQPNQRAFLELAKIASLTPAVLEYRLLKWAFAGLLDYRPIGRTYLYTLPTPPADASRRVEALLDQYSVIQGQRVQEIWEYTRTAYCRHGYLAAYLGGLPREKCEVCDNCTASTQPAAHRPESHLPSDREQSQTILQILKGKSWGRANLISLLCGDRRRASDAAQNSPAFGKLAFRSATQLDKMVASLADGGWLAEKKLSHGGMVLELTRKGHAALENPELLEKFTPGSTPASPQDTAPETSPWPLPSQEVSTPSPEPDVHLLAALRDWRAQRAKQDDVSAFIVAHNHSLDEIALFHPQTTGELLRIKGFGPSRAEKYGDEILMIVRLHTSSSRMPAPPVLILSSPIIPPDAEPDPITYEALKAWCMARAKQDNVPTFFILPKEVLRNIAIVRPQTLANLQSVKGIGSKKLVLFGEEILRVIHATQSSSHPQSSSV